MWYYKILLVLTSWSAVYFVIALPAVLLVINFVIGNCFLSEELARCHHSERQCILYKEEKLEDCNNNIYNNKDFLNTSTNGSTRVVVRKGVVGTNCHVKQHRQLGRLCVIGILTLLTWEYVVYMYSYRSSNMYRVVCADRENITHSFLALFGIHIFPYRNYKNSTNNYKNVISEKSTCNPIEFIFTIVDHLPACAVTDALHSLLHCRLEVLLFQCSWLMVVLTYLWCLVSTSQINVVVINDMNNNNDEESAENYKKCTEESSTHVEINNNTIDDHNNIPYKEYNLQQVKKTLCAKNLYYCTSCASYIAAKDHHCYFIDNCVGAHNKHIYLYCLAATCVHLSFVIWQMFSWVINERGLVLHAGLMLAMTADVLIFCLLGFHFTLLRCCCTTRQFVKTVRISRRGYWCNFLQLVKGTLQPREI